MQDAFVEPPISVHGSAGKYAAALFSAASKAKVLEQTNTELHVVQKMSEDSKDFMRFLKDPTLSREKKVEALEAITTDMKLCATTKRFMGLLAENNRLGELPAIATTFDDIMAAVRGEVKATVTTAEALKDSEVKELRESLGHSLSQGQKLYLTQKVDPSLIGGFIVDIGDKHMDMSIISRVKKVQQLIMDSSE